MPETTLTEVCAAGELCDLIADSRGFCCLRRWPRAWRVYRLVLIVQRPLLGFWRARATAARTAFLFCLPRGVCRRLARVLPTFTWP